MKKWWTLGVVSMGTFMLMLDLSVVMIALPPIHESLHGSLTDLQWVFDAYSLTLAIFLVAAGSLADRIGRKKVFQSGFALFTLASLACGLSGTAVTLSVSRAVQGIGAAVMFAVGPALLGHEFRGRERATAFTAFGAATGLAVAVGPLIGGSLTSAFSWRWIFFINVPVGVLALLAGALRMRESADRQASPVDRAGLITVSVALGALVFAIIRAPEQGWTSAATLSLYAVSAVFFLVFVLAERRQGERAMIDLSFFRNRTFTGISLVALLGNAAALPSVFFETSYMENILRANAWDTGLRFLPLTVAMFAAGAAGGALTGKVPARVLLGGACVVMGGGLLFLILVHADSAWTALVPCLVISGAGMGVFNPVRAALAVGVAEPSRAGTASGINETFQQVGVAVGIAGVGAWFASIVSDRFTSSAAGQHLGPDAAARAARGISAGGADAVARSAGIFRSEVLAAAQNAYMTAFHDVMAFCAALGILAGITGLLLVRRQDLHASALEPLAAEPGTAAAPAGILSPGPGVPGEPARRRS